MRNSGRAVSAAMAGSARRKTARNRGGSITAYYLSVTRDPLVADANLNSSGTGGGRVPVRASALPGGSTCRDHRRQALHHIQLRRQCRQAVPGADPVGLRQNRDRSEEHTSEI